MRVATDNQTVSRTLMLKIRPEQFTAFQSVAEADFEKRLAQYLCEAHPKVIVQLPDSTSALGQMADDRLGRIVRSGVARARDYGLRSEAAISGFIVLLFITAPNFDSHPLIRRILQQSEIAPDARLELIWERTTDQNWEAVEQHYDPQAWDAGASEF